MRKVMVLLHRWFGLGIALFLLQAGITGALIAWDHEIDAFLNPELYVSAAPADAELLPPLRLAEIVETRDPRLEVTYLPLAVEPGHTVLLGVAATRAPATGQPYVLGFDQVAVNPATGDIQDRREWGEISLSKKQLMPFLYRLHYSLHIPEVGLMPLGLWFMGIVAVIWLFDSFIALWISFPSWKAWKKSFQFRLDKGGYRLTFDLHRSGGVWTWLLIMPLALTAVSMNLNREVMRPVVSVFSDLAESPFASRTPSEQGIVATTSRQQILKHAATDALALDLGRPQGGLFYSQQYGVYGVGFFEPGNDHGDGGLGNPWLYYDGKTGAPAGSELPGRGSAGDLFMQVQFPLHSGRILGVPGRILITLLGLVVSMFSVTGVMIWAKKRRQRVLAEVRDGRGSDARGASVMPRPEPTV
jgi:uncharacterized iron-regulated membrane protein